MRLLLLLGTLAFVGCGSAPQPYRAEVDAIAQPLLERGYATDIVVAVIDGDHTAFYVYGPSGADEHTLFEIGSVSKTFTSALLAEMVGRGDVSLETTLGETLADLTMAPEMQAITLLDLSTHTSGLPRLPNNIDLESDPGNPYAGYDEAALLEYLSQATPGARNWAYSNLGAGLLGYLLGQTHGGGYEAAVTERVLTPLGMKETAIVLTPDLEKRLTRGHDLLGRPVPHWDLPTLAGAGALRSTAHDMTRYLRANMGQLETSLDQALRASHQMQRASGIPDFPMGLGWFVTPDGEMAWHNGGTGGFYTFVGFHKERGVGVVWLSNAAMWRIPQIDGALVQLVKGEPIEPLELKKPIEVSTDVLASYEGTYSYMLLLRFEVRLEGGVLMFSRPDEAGAALLPESENRFFILEAPQLLFEFVPTEDGGMELVLYEDGDVEMRATRK